MKLNGIRQFSKFLYALLASVVCAGLSSCHAVWQEEPVCDQGLSIRFIYDYNMEDANAFMSQVDCLTVFVYKENGEYVTTVTETDRAKLKDENWRMNINLPEGRYKVVAYGGMACPESSFDFVGGAPAAGSVFDSRRVRLKPSCLTAPVGTNLHPLFYGFSRTSSSDSEILVAEVEYNDPDYVPVTVYMMKDTNNIRILLQNINGDPLTGDDFEFSLTGDNTLMDYDNSLIPAGSVTYRPWVKGQEKAGILPDGSEATLAYAELSTGRLVNGNKATLCVKSVKDGKEVFNIPVINYLLLLKSQEYAWMGKQEFLDRESRWNVIFFLDHNNSWVTTHIVVNDWVVRIENIELS